MEFSKWASANCFWIQVDRLYENRGPGKPGNQLDCTKGTRAFFGFKYKDIDEVPKHTKLGEVIMRYGAKPLTSRSVWFAHNAMDKVHLPVPERYGPKTYDDLTVHFERVPGRFVITVGTPADIKNWKQISAKQGLHFELGQGRHFGFYQK